MQASTKFVTCLCLQEQKYTFSKFVELCFTNLFLLSYGDFNAQIVNSYYILHVVAIGSLENSLKLF